MPSQTKQPTDSANVGSGVAIDWDNETNAYVSNNTYADCNNGIAGTQDSDLLDLFDCDFEIPAGATIDAITIQYEAKESVTGASNKEEVWMRDNAGNPSTDSHVDDPSLWTDSDALYDYQPVDPLWGELPDSDFINHTNFGGRVQCNIDGFGTVYVDVMNITVEYTEAGGGGWPWERPFIESIAAIWR